MRGAALPAALLCAALGLMLARARWRMLGLALLLLCTSAFAATFLPIRDHAVEMAFAGCWTSIILLAAAVHLRGVPPWLAVAASLDAGLWAGAVIAAEGARLDLSRALPAFALCIPAHLAWRRGWDIPVKVVSSWLIAVALLAALLPTTPTPGYVPDHMD